MKSCSHERISAEESLVVISSEARSVKVVIWVFSKGENRRWNLPVAANIY